MVRAEADHMESSVRAATERTKEAHKQADRLDVRGVE